MSLTQKLPEYKGVDSYGHAGKIMLITAKADLKKLEGKIDRRFEQVDKRFGQIDKKLGRIDMRLGIFKLEWDAWKQDAFTEFNSRWLNRIDPILAEIEKHREKETIWAEQNRRVQLFLEKVSNKLNISFDE